MKFKLFIFTTLTVALLACQNEQPTFSTSVNGIWQSIGSGWYLEISDSSEYAFYDATAISCLPSRAGNFSEIAEELDLQNDTLSLQIGPITYFYTFTKTLPEFCQHPLTETQQRDPLYNFNVFAETVAEHYVFMELNAINWDSLYQAQKSKLSATSTDAELYRVIEETLEKLNDNHAFLEAPDEVYKAIEQEFPEPEEVAAAEDELPEYGDFQIANRVAKHHLQEDMTKDSWLMSWGEMTDSIGFLQVKAMWLHADLDISKDLIEEMGYVDAYVHTFHQMYDGDYIKKEVEAVRQTMDKVMNDLSDMSSIVIDVRFNGGGQDAVSFEILRHFIEGKLQIGTQKLKNENGYSPLLPMYIEGVEQPYIKPIYVLTSSQTGSAAESFSIATIAMDNAKRIGSPTSGAISTALEKTLPNGWAFAISNEIYMDNQGIFYENRGVPADYEIKYSLGRQPFFRSVADDLAGDKQQILMAIEELTKR